MNPEEIRREEEIRDLGFGAVVARESRLRLLNRDGSFNVRREGLRFWASLSLYQSLLTMSWTHFLTLLVVSFFAINGLFGLAYVFCGPGALAGPAEGVCNQGFLLAFFFSVHTFSTIGYGHIVPVGLASNLVVTVESLVGLLWVALSTGLIFARFSRPTAKILFSQKALMAPYQDITAFEFRIVNSRSNQVIELEAKVLFSRFVNEKGRKVRRFELLNLERNKVAFFPLSWTIVHPINENSPLYGLTDQDLNETDAEFLILLTGIDETFCQTVHTRSSYKPSEIIWGARFSNLFNHPEDNQPITIQVDRLHAYEAVDHPTLKSSSFRNP